MSATEQQVFVQALSLPAPARAALACKLLESLEQEAGSPEIEAAWKQEALARCEAFDSGHLPDHDAEEVLREAYRKVK